MEKKFTPGPWFYQEVSDAYTHIVRPILNTGRIIHHGPQSTGEEHEANARLIAAAPELLEALEGLKEEIERFEIMSGALSGALHLAKQAIDKAYGKEVSK